MIRLQCPGCDKEYKLRDELDGKRFRCRECDELIRVRDPQSAPDEDEREETEEIQDKPRPRKKTRPSAEATGTREKPDRPRKKKPKQKEKASSQLWLFVGGGALAVAVIALVLILVLKDGDSNSGDGDQAANNNTNKPGDRNQPPKNNGSNKGNRQTAKPDPDKTSALRSLESVSQVRFAPNGALVTVRRKHKEKQTLIDFWTLSTETRLLALTDTVSDPGFPFDRIAFSSDGNWMATGVVGVVRIWDLKKRALYFTYEPKRGPRPRPGEKFLAFSADNQHLLTMISGVLIGIDLNKKTAKGWLFPLSRFGEARYHAPTDRIMRVHLFFNKQGNQKTEIDVAGWKGIRDSTPDRAVQDEDHKLEFILSQYQSRTIPIPDMNAICTCISRNGKFFAIATASGDVHVYDTTTWKLKATLPAEKGHKVYQAEQMALSPDGSFLYLLPMHEGTPALRRWNVGEPQAKVLPYTRLREIALAPNGQLLALAFSGKSPNGNRVEILSTKTDTIRPVPQVAK